MQTRISSLLHVSALFCACVTLVGCNSGDDDPPAIGVATPGAPTNLTANVGPTAISLGWDAPANTGGNSIQGYEVEVTPAVPTPNTNVTVIGTRALLRGLTTGVSYTIAVRARSSSGLGSATPSITVATPQQVVAGSYTPIAISGDTSPSGIFDPSVLRVSNTETWMSYSSVNYHSPGGILTRDVGIRLARSINGGQFVYQTTIASPSDVTLGSCGLANCQGRWVYETSWLIDDSTDIAARRYKLFAHKYFLKPGNTPDTLYHLGAIVMWTASLPGGPWSGETNVIGWDSAPSLTTPVELISPSLRIVNDLHTDLVNCIVVSEGSASVRGSTIDFAFACPYSNGGTNLQKIVLLRSTDHASTFQYVSTLLTAADAAPASYFSAPALLSTAGSAPVLLATPVVNGVYTGCFAIPFSDDAAGSLFRVSNVPAGLVYTPAQNNSSLISGACAYDRSLGTRGILLSNTIAGAAPFAIFATTANLQP
jgi:hypothetical protein